MDSSLFTHDVQVAHSHRELIHKRSQHHSPIIAQSGNTPKCLPANGQVQSTIQSLNQNVPAFEDGVSNGCPRWKSSKNKILCSIAFRLFVRDGCEAHIDFMLKHGFCITLLTTIVVPASHSQFEGGLHHGGERMATGAETASHTTVRSKKGWALVLA